ncbi:MAG: TOBE domain-containing protein, partial [Myxococcota bacterium]
YVTHDQEEALTLGDRLAVMNDGLLEQVDAPRVVYERPASVFVAGFVGAPPMNLVPAMLQESGVRAGALRLELPPGERRRPSGETGTLGIRPQDLSLTEHGDADLIGTVELVEPLGHLALVHVESDPPLRTVVAASTAPRPNERVGLRIDPARIHLFDAHGRRC